MKRHTIFRSVVHFDGCETGSTLSLVEIAAEYSTEVSNNKMAHNFVQKNNFSKLYCTHNKILAEHATYSLLKIVTMYLFPCKHNSTMHAPTEKKVMLADQFISSFTYLLKVERNQHNLRVYHDEIRKHKAGNTPAVNGIYVWP